MIKKMKWVLMASALTVSLVVSSTAQASSFPDVSNNYWGKPHIERLANMGAISGFEDGTFGPNKNVTRAQAAKMLVVAFKLPEYKTGETKFSDVKDSHWAKVYIDTLSKHNIIGGFEDGTFKPNDKLTRAQMTAIISKNLRLHKTSSVSFKDIHSDQWFATSVNQVTTAGIASGYEDGYFRPQENITRGHMAALLSKAIDVGPQKDVSADPTPNPVPNPVPTPEVKPDVKPDVKPSEPSADINDMDEISFNVLNVTKSGTSAHVELAVTSRALQDKTGLAKFSAAYVQEVLALNPDVQAVKISFKEQVSETKVNSNASAVYENGKLK